MIEELAEQGEPRIEWSRQACVRCHVGYSDVIAIHDDSERLKRRIANDARGFKIDNRDIVRGSRRCQRIYRSLLGGCRRCVRIAIAEGVCRCFGIIHDNARLVFRIGDRLVNVVNGLHQGHVGEVRGHETANLQTLDDGCRIAQGLVDDQVGDCAQTGVEDHRTRIVGGIVVGRHWGAEAGRDGLGRPKHRIEQFWEWQIGRAPMFLARQQVVV
ncbi:hypothetical protein [Tardiphaga sp. 285_C5_N1_2]|uniref:hypothetical protein n=1 Tax=Tardiphaga sp. 285_C5_N1_2 TaxID=3240775 RepID=UPI003F8C2C3F